MKQWIALMVAIAFFVASAPVYAIDLSIPDMLHGEQVAAGPALDQHKWDTVPSYRQWYQDRWNEQIVYEDELNERIAYERDKTNDTTALVAWGLVLLLALTMNGRNGNDGADGADGEPGIPGPPGPPGGCR